MHKLARLTIPPCLAFLVSCAVVVVAAAGAGVDPWSPASRLAGDAGIYLSIASDGYTLEPCQGSSYQPGTWCGNAGWFPGYPWLVRGLTGLAATSATWALVLPVVFHAACLWLLWAGFFKAELHPKAWAALALASLFPSLIYFHAGFPISQFLFFAMAALWCLARGRLWLGAIAGAVAAFTYSTGFILAVVFAVWTLVALPRSRWPAGLSAATLVLSGFLMVLVVGHVTVGRWDAFFLVQAKYGHGLGNPAAALQFRTGALFSRALWERVSNDAVALRAANNRLVVAEGGGGREVLANRESPGPWETFELVPQPGGSVALRAFHGQFLSMSGQTARVEATAVTVGPLATFRLVPAGGRHVALQGIDNSYLHVDEGDEGNILSGSPQIGSAELFELVPVENSAIARMTAAGSSLLILVVVMLGLLYWAVRATRIRDVLTDPDNRLDLVVVLYGAAFYVIPLVIGAQATGRRAESLLLPVMLLLRRAPLVVQLVTLLACAYFAVGVAEVYFVARD